MACWLADVSDDGSVMEDRYRYENVDTSGAAEGFEEDSTLYRDYDLDDAQPIERWEQAVHRQVRSRAFAVRQRLLNSASAAPSNQVHRSDNGIV